MPVRPATTTTAPPEIIDPVRYRVSGYPQGAWRRLRQRAPVAWCEAPGFDPFWAITRHADIVAISKDPARFPCNSRFAMTPNDAVDLTKLPVRHLLNMNPPEHRSYRKLTSPFFTRRHLEPKRPAIERIVDELLDEAAEKEEIDFVTQIASTLPLAVIAEMLGLPREDWPRFYQWTNRIAGCADPEFCEGSAESVMASAIAEQFSYFRELVAERRRAPRQDLTSVLASARIDGQAIPEVELLSYLFLLVTAGNETTRNAASRGLMAFMEFPGELERLQRQPELAASACEEVLRYTSPVIQLCRGVAQDLELHGQRLRVGDPVVLFYASANRDERVFEDPDRFRIDRRPNPHLAFGTGEHLCLGSHLARLELVVLLEALARRTQQIELRGEAQRLQGSCLGGIKSLPVRLVLRSAS